MFRIVLVCTHSWSPRVRWQKLNWTDFELRMSDFELTTIIVLQYRKRCALWLLHISLLYELFFYVHEPINKRVLRRMADRTLTFQYRPQLGGSFQTKVYLKRKVNHANLAGRSADEGRQRKRDEAECTESRTNMQNVFFRSSFYIALIYFLLYLVKVAKKTYIYLIQCD